MNYLTKIIAAIAFIIISAILGVVLAFPIKWCWNYVMPYAFGLPIIGWGHAWCLSFLSGSLIKSTLLSNKD